MTPRVVIALGGNALGDTPLDQLAHVEAAIPALLSLIEQGHEIIITHGNGPQVGAINNAFQLASKEDKSIPTMPLPECTAMSQGYIGYHLQQSIVNELLRQALPWHVATVVTQVAVDPDDPAFVVPTKPIGPFLTAAQAEKEMEKDPASLYVEDSGRGWRRVVASPRPLDILEKESILNLLDHDYIVIANGGGGIPVVKDDRGYRGIPAVIDKDLSAALLAEIVNAETLIILTAVDNVSINWGKPDQMSLGNVDVKTLEKYIEEGHFAPGSMLPKVQAAIGFVKSGPGRQAIICSLEKAPQAILGHAGTKIQG